MVKKYPNSSPFSELPMYIFVSELKKKCTPFIWHLKITQFQTNVYNLHVGQSFVITVFFIKSKTKAKVHSRHLTNHLIYYITRSFLVLHCGALWAPELETSCNKVDKIIGQMTRIHFCFHLRLYEKGGDDKRLSYM